LDADTIVDAEVVDACQSLQAAGCALALDDFSLDSDARQLLPFAKFVKIDVTAVSPATQAEIAAVVLPRGVRMIANHVETADVAATVRNGGFDLLQGFFFCRPTIVSSRLIPARRLAYLQLLAELNRPDLSVDRLEELIKHDASL